MGIEHGHLDGIKWMAFDNLAAEVQDVALPNHLVVSPPILALPLFNVLERIAKRMRIAVFVGWCNPCHDCFFVHVVGLLCVPLRN